MKTMNPALMTNRELFVEYERGRGQRYELVVEMAKRLHRRMITPDIVSVFKQYKLNGAGDRYE